MKHSPSTPTPRKALARTTPGGAPLSVHTRCNLQAGPTELLQQTHGGSYHSLLFTPPDNFTEAAATILCCSLRQIIFNGLFSHRRACTHIKPAPESSADWSGPHRLEMDKRRPSDADSSISPLQRPPLCIIMWARIIFVSLHFRFGSCCGEARAMRFLLPVTSMKQR